MTDTTLSADIIPLRKRPMTGAERQRACRARKAAKAAAGLPVTLKPVTVTPSRVTVTTPASRTSRTSHVPGASILLTVAAFTLAVVGVTMNAWFARSLGSSDVAGWLFLGIGVAADLAALAIPSCAARFWNAHQRGAACVGWLVWLATFCFALTAGVGFASVNIADVTQVRASRVTPQVEQAQLSLRDATEARDRECKGGVGKFCREREAVVAERTSALQVAQSKVEQASDPQIAAAAAMTSWVSHGWLAPTARDFEMLRLVLLALLPQLGGILLMLARRPA